MFPFDPGGVLSSNDSASLLEVSPQFPFDPGTLLEDSSALSSSVDGYRPCQPVTGKPIYGDISDQVTADIFSKEIDRERLLRCGAVFTPPAAWQRVLRWFIFGGVLLRLVFDFLGATLLSLLWVLQSVLEFLIGVSITCANALLSLSGSELPQATTESPTFFEAAPGPRVRWWSSLGPYRSSPDHSAAEVRHHLRQMHAELRVSPDDEPTSDLSSCWFGQKQRLERDRVEAAWKEAQVKFRTQVDGREVDLSRRYFELQWEHRQAFLRLEKERSDRAAKIVLPFLWLLARFKSAFDSAETKRKDALTLAQAVDELLDSAHTELSPPTVPSAEPILTGQPLDEVHCSDFDGCWKPLSWKDSWDRYLAKCRLSPSHWVQELSPFWSEPNTPLASLAALQVGLGGGQSDDLAAMEFSCHLGMGTDWRKSHLLADSGSQLTLMRSSVATSLGLSVAPVGSVKFDCLDANGHVLPFRGQLSQPFSFQLRDQHDVWSTMTIDSNSGRLSDRILLVDNLPVPFLLGRPAMGTLDFKLGLRDITVERGDQVFFGRRPGNVRTPVAAMAHAETPLEPKIVGKSSRRSHRQESKEDIVELVYPLCDETIAPLESARVRLSLDHSSYLRFFVADLSQAERDGYGCSDGALPGGSYPWVLVTNESLLPLELSSLVPLGQVHVLRAPRVFVVAKESPDVLIDTVSATEPDQPLSEITGFPLPSADITRSTLTDIPVRLTPKLRSHACSPVSALRDYHIEPRSRKKILLWLPPDKDALHRELVLCADSLSVLGISVDLSQAIFLKNDHPTPCLWIQNDSDHAVRLNSTVIIGQVGTVFKSTVPSTQSVLQNTKLANLAASDEAKAQFQRKILMAQMAQKSDNVFSHSDLEEPPSLAFSAGFTEIAAEDLEKNLACSDEKLLSLCSSNMPKDDTSIWGDRQSGFLRVLQFYRDVFTNSFSGEPWDIEDFDIPLKPDAVPYQSRGYRFCHAHLEALKNLLDKWVAEGVCSRAVSPWASPAFFVPKPGGRGLRFVVDYRELNKMTIPDRFPLPVIEDLFAQFNGDTIFSSWDCLSGFNQMSVSEAARKLTAFVTPLGTFQVHRMMMGLRSAPSFFSRGMMLMCTGLVGAKIYLDDVAISSGAQAGSTEEEGLDDWDIHLLRIGPFLHRCATHHLRLNPDKCNIGNGEIKYLGYIISAEGLRPDPAKGAAVQTIAAPKDPHDVRVFLGLINYYRSFIPYCAEWSAPLSSLLSKGVPFVWGPSQQEAFDKLKQSLVDQCLRSHYDPTYELELYTDCSKYASGAVLSQKIPVTSDSGLDLFEDRVLAYFSRTLSAAERNYSTHQQECLAIISAIKYFHQFLAGRHFKLFTDHYSLATVMRWRDPPMRIARWIQLLSEYDFTASYKAGSTLCNADALSRLPSHYVSRHLGLADLPGSLSVRSYHDLDPLTSNPRLQDMLEERLPSLPEVSARTPVGPIWVSPVQTRSRSVAADLPSSSANTMAEPSQESPVVAEDSSAEPDLEPLTSENWPFEKVFSYLGRRFSDPETGRLYVISDLWWDETLQDFLGCRSPIDGLPVDVNELKTPFVFDYFLQQLNEGPIEFHDSVGQQSLVNDQFRRDAEVSADKWLATGILQSHELFYLPDEFGVPHLYRRFIDESVKQEHYQLIIPDGPSGEVVRHHLLFQCHSGGGGHLKMHKMYVEMQRRCFWKGMYSDVARYSQSCEVCQARGTSRDRREGSVPILKWPPVSAPFQRVSIDILGPLGNAQSGFTHLVVAVDHFTKWVEAEAYRGAPSAQDVNQFFMHHFVHRHGVPDCLVADNGSNIISNQLNSVMFQDLGADIRNVTTYHPQANGQVERLNAVICDFLSKYCSQDDQQFWDRFLEATIFAINTSVNRVTGYTPFFLVHGREARRIIDKRLPDWTGFKWRKNGWGEYADFVQQELDRCSKVAREHLDKSHSMYNQPLAVHRVSSSFGFPEQRLRRKSNLRRFAVSDQVLLYVPVPKDSRKHIQIRKLQKFWRGPFTIERCLNDVTYLVRLSPTKVQPFHVSRLKPYFERSEFLFQPF